MSPIQISSAAPLRGSPAALPRGPHPEVLAALLAPALRESVKPTLAPRALAAELAFCPEVRALEDALEAGRLSRAELQRFLAEQIEQVCRFATFVHDLSLCALAVAVDRSFAPYRGSLLRALAYFPSTRLELSRPLAFSCLGPGGRFDPFAEKPGAGAALRLGELGVLPAGERSQIVARIVELALGLPGREVRALLAEKEAIERRLGIPGSALGSGVFDPRLRGAELARRWRAVVERLGQLTACRPGEPPDSRRGGGLPS